MRWAINRRVPQSTDVPLPEPVPAHALPGQRGLDFPELREPGFGGIAGGAVLGVGDVLLGVLHFLGELRRVDVGDGWPLSTVK